MVTEPLTIETRCSSFQWFSQTGKKRGRRPRLRGSRGRGLVRQAHHRLWRVQGAEPWQGLGQSPKVWLLTLRAASQAQKIADSGGFLPGALQDRGVAVSLLPLT